MSYVLDERLSMLTPYQPIQGNYRIRLDANESFIPLSDSVKEKLKISLDNLDFNRYPDPYAKDLIEAYGKVISTSPKNLVAGNGSDELIGLICGAFLADNAKVVTLTPDFSMYSFYTNIRKAYTYPFPRSNDFLPDADKLIKYINDTLPTILIFSNPNNPTGAAIEVDTVEKIIKSVSCLVVVDEAYMDFSSKSVLHLINKYDNLIVLRTISKLYGAAALRVGFAAAGEKLISVLRAAKSPYNINAISQVFATILLSETGLTQNLIDTIKAAKGELYNGLRELKQVLGKTFSPYPSETNFVFIRAEKAEEIYERLLRDGIAVRCFPPCHLRITAGNESENKELIKYLRSYK